MQMQEWIVGTMERLKQERERGIKRNFQIV